MTMSLAQNHYIIQLPQTPLLHRAPEPRSIAQKWITEFEVLLRNNDFSKLPQLFHEDSWWRDLLCLTWDFHTIQNLSGITAFLSENQPRARLFGFRLQHEGKFQPRLEHPAPGLTWISTIFFFETSTGRGSGVFRLTQDKEGLWKAYAIYTSLQELRGMEEPVGLRRVYGTTETMPGGLAGGTWIERRKRQILFDEEEPTALIVGAGKQSIPVLMIPPRLNGV
jgi:hypothetical protein